MVAEANGIPLHGLNPNTQDFFFLRAPCAFFSFAVNGKRFLRSRKFEAFHESTIELLFRLLNSAF